MKLSLFSQYRGLRKEIYILFFGRVVTNLGSMIWPMLTMILSQKLGLRAAMISYVMVSAGVIMTDVPYVINWNYQEATEKLQEAGFIVQQELEQSDSVTKDYVIRMDPEPGQSVVSGSVVKLVISGGTELRTVPMPDLTNLSESAAIARIESNGLTLGSVYREANDAPAGTVFRQSTAAGTDIAQFSKIYIWVSTGPAPTDEAPAGE